MCDIGLMELIDNAYKFKQTKERELVEETLVEITSQYALFSESETCFVFFQKSLSPPELPSAQPPTSKRPAKHLRDGSKYNLVLLQNLFMKEKWKK